MSSSSSAAVLPASMRIVAVKPPGNSSSSLYLSSAPVPSLSSSPHSVLIHINSFGINRADISQRGGHYPPPAGVTEILGLEGSGIIVDVGSEVKNGQFKKGDRVMALFAGGSYAEYAVVDAGSVMHVPDSFSFQVAAGIPEAFLTAYQLLTLSSRSIRPNDTVVIHAAASGVGVAAVQIASKLFGALVIGTAGSDDKCKEVIGLGAKFCINYKSSLNLTTSIIESLQSASNGKKSTSDYTLDCVGKNYIQLNLQIASMDGVLVQYAFMSGASAELDLRPLLAKRIQWLGSTLRTRSIEYKTNLVSGFEKEVLPAIVSKKIEVKIDSVLNIEEIAAAHERMEKNLNTGKIIVTFEQTK